MRIRKPRAIIGMTIHKIEVNIIIVSETTNNTTNNEEFDLNIENDLPDYDLPESGRTGKELARYGLNSQQVRDRMAKGKVNVQIDRTAKTTKDIIKENVFTYFNLIFLIISILLIMAGAFRSLTFLPVVIANTLIGIFQEMHAKKVLDGLSILHEPNAIAIRDGARSKVAIGKLVLDDVIVLEAGNQIPADAVILDGEVAVNEALLTGEADEIVKGSGEELMSGSFIASGRCTAQLTKVGQDSYISNLMLKARKMPVGEQSEMVRSINRIVIAAGILIIPIGLTLFIQSYMTQGNSFSDSVVSMVAAVIGMIPEGLYLLVSVTLATSTVLQSIETLARVDTLCVDKTGTITDNSMLVADAVPAQKFTDDQLRRYKALVGEYLTVLPDDNITMKAMRDYFRGRGSRQAVSVFPFSSKHKYSSVQFTDSTFVLGAPEFVLCEDFPQYSDIVDEYAMKGLRVLVFARYMGEETGAAAKVRRCTQPQAQVLMSRPVPAVVPALASLPGIIGDLIAPVALRGQKLLREMVDPAVLLLGGQLRKLLLIQHGSERRPLLDDEAVGGQMLRPQGSRFAQCIGPGFNILTRKRRHQIQVDVGKAGFPRGAKDLPRLGRGVDPPKQPQFIVVKRLHANGEPVDAGLPESAEFLRICRSGIDLHADLRTVHYRAGAADRIHHAP